MYRLSRRLLRGFDVDVDVDVTPRQVHNLGHVSHAGISIASEMREKEKQG